ncbi:alpha-E domain-containing protein [Luteolibacter flavescens]|uniref:Alpha-E domain-containing protein n=1 Tax=Luteolibacter flavescens TaxID=1859460 RepID=A0ABT3FSC3_9BACT|nr:alpha-E domain-containing protein [Luteolibacter flavescens]MCW1886483.1 alpha-E domain-containing protein [Luteolibacter flavescens]
MLSRVANSLYWMVRYIERADNLSRLIEVNGQLLLDHERLDSERLRAFWKPIILATGDDELFGELYSDASSGEVIRFLTDDRKNPNSIVSSIAQARENARMVRDQLSEELWEELNGLYLFINSRAGENLLTTDPTRYYETIRRATFTFHGIAAASIARSESWEFMDLGRHLERADKTTRFLDITSFLPEVEDGNGAATFHWTAILRSCGALGAFRAEHLGQPSAKSVLDLLMFSNNFPRSVRYCVDRIDRNLHRISGSPRGTYTNGAERVAGRMLAELAYGSAEEVLESGLHGYLDDAQTRFNEIGDGLFRAYVFPDITDARPPIPAASVSAVVAWQMSQQQQ